VTEDGLIFGSQHGQGSVSSQERPDQLWRPPGLLFSGYRGYFLTDAKSPERLHDV